MTRSAQRTAVGVAAALVVAVLLVLCGTCGGDGGPRVPSEGDATRGTPAAAGGRAPDHDPDPTPRSRAPGRAGRAARPDAAPARLTRTVVRAGRDDAADTPVAGARVRRFAADDLHLTAFVEADAGPLPPLDETTSAADGTFSFDVGDGEGWRVTASLDSTHEAGATTGGGAADVTIVLRPSTARRLRFVDAADGAPVAGARALAWIGAADGPADQVAVAGADGRVTLELSADATVLVLADGYRAALLSGDAVPVGGDVALRRGAPLRGRVVGPDGVGVGGARLAASEPLRGFVAYLGVRTDADGRFTLPAADPGETMRLHVRAAGFAVATRVVRPGETDVVIVLESPAFVVAAVVDEAGAPAVDAVVEGGRPLGGGEFEVGPCASGIVHVQASRGDEQGEECAVVHAGERARVRVVLRALRRGSVRCRVVAPEGVDLAQTGVEFGLPDRGGQVGACSAGSDGWSQWSGGCPPGVPLVARVHVRAEDAAIVPVDDVPFTMGPYDAPTEVVVHAARGVAVHLAFVDARGAGITYVGPPQPHRVLSGAARDVGWGLWVAEDARFRLRVTIPGWLPHDAEHAWSEVRDGVLVVTMDRGATVRGRVVRGAGDEPPVFELSAEVVQPGTVPGRRAVGEDGDFIASGLRRGDATILVRLDEDVLLRRAVRIDRDDVDAGDLRVGRPVRLTGRVVDERGAGVGDARVGVRSAEVACAATTDASGGFELWVPDGARLVLVASTDDLVTRPETVFGAEDAAPVVVRALPAPHVYLRAAEIGVSGVDLVARAADGAAEVGVRAETVGADLVGVRDLPPGRWTLTATWSGRTATAAVAVAPGALVEVPLR